MSSDVDSCCRGSSIGYSPVIQQYRLCQPDIHSEIDFDIFHHKSVTFGFRLLHFWLLHFWLATG